VASPFTSKTPDISCVPILIREGRCALVTSFSIFKFMALYSLAEFITAAILYAYESNLGDWQYLYIDLVLIFSFSIVMGYTGPYPHLVKRRPLGTLAGVHVLLSLCLQTVVMVIVQVAALLYLKSQPWYQPLHPDPESGNIESSENSVLFQISIFQYVALAVALSTAAPYRNPLYTNGWFFLVLLLLVPLNMYFTLAPAHWWPWLWGVVQIKPHPSFLFSLTLVELAFVHFLIAHLLEGYILPSQGVRLLMRCVRCKRQPRNKYKQLLRSLPPHWPP
jgi:magnesium-transporting ATPase (P-type)